MKKTKSNMKSNAKESTQKLSSLMDMNEVVTQWKKDILLGRKKLVHAHVHGEDISGGEVLQNSRPKIRPSPGEGTGTEPAP